MSDRADTCVRADSSTSIGTPSDGGSAWVAVAGVGGISSNAIVKISGPTYCVFALEASSTVGDVRATVRTLGSSGVAGRIVDANNFLWVQRYAGGQTYLWRRVGGTFTQLGPTYTGATAENDIWRLSFDSSNAIRVYQNEVLRIGPVTDSSGSTATRHGFVYESAVARWNDFSFTDAAGGGTLNASLTDAAAGVDISSATVTLAATLADATAAVELATSTATRAASLQDAASAVDLCTSAATMLASLAEAAAGSDAQSAALVANATLLDAALAADLASAMATMAAQLVDGASALDVLTATRIANAAALEAAAAADLVNLGSTYSTQVLEAASAADALSAAATLVVQLVEAGTVLDQLNAAPSLVALLTEAAAGTDLASAAVPQVYSVTALELAAALDLLHAAMGSGVTLAPGRRQVAMPSVQQLQRTVQMPAVGQLRRAVALYPS